MKEYFWPAKSVLEVITHGWDGSENNPFILKRQELNFYVDDEYRIIKLICKEYKILWQVLINQNNKNIDKISIIYKSKWELTKRDIYFDLTEVF